MAYEWPTNGPRMAHEWHTIGARLACVWAKENDIIIRQRYNRCSGPVGWALPNRKIPLVILLFLLPAGANRSARAPWALPKRKISLVILLFSLLAGQSARPPAMPGMGIMGTTEPLPLSHGSGRTVPVLPKSKIISLCLWGELHPIRSASCAANHRLHACPASKSTTMAFSCQGEN